MTKTGFQKRVEIRVNLLLDANSGIPLNQQIKVQLRYLILSGELAPGMQIPSVRELASFLKTNRNTVAKAYKELGEEGYLDIRQASGTYVAQTLDIPPRKDTKKFVSVLKKAMQQSLELGFSAEEFVNMAQMIMLKGKKNSSNVKALFVECNSFALEQYVKDLAEALSISVEGVLLDDLEQGKVSKQFLHSFDFVVTTAGHYPRVLELIGDELNIYGINIGPYLKVLEQLLSCPRDARIGIVCMSSRSGSEGLKQVLFNLGVRSDSIIEADATEDEIYKIAQDVDIIVASKFALKANKETFEKINKKVIEYENVLSEASIEILRKVIEKILRRL